MKLKERLLEQIDNDSTRYLLGQENPTDDIRTEFQVKIFYQNQKDLNHLRFSEGKWIDSKQLCMNSQLNEKLHLHEQLMLHFLLPESSITIELKGQVEHIDCDDGSLVVSHDGCHRNRTDYISDLLADYLARKTWEKGAIKYINSPQYRVITAINQTLYQASSQLIYKEYRLKGYCPQNQTNSYLNYYAMLPDARTFMIYREDILVGTFTILPDSPFGLPAETIYQDEITRLRAKKRKIAELSLLAFDGEKINARNNYLLTHPLKMFLFVKLIREINAHAYKSGITDLIVATHPQHEKNYKFLQFNKIGDVKSYPSACNNLAILMHCDLAAMRTKFSKSQYNRYSIYMDVNAYLYEMDFSVIGNNKNYNLSNLLGKNCSELPKEVYSYFQYCYPGSL